MQALFDSGSSESYIHLSLAEVERLLKEGIIEPYQSPWQTQVVVTKNENHKKCLAIDYSQTIN